MRPRVDAARQEADEERDDAQSSEVSSSDDGERCREYQGCLV